MVENVYLWGMMWKIPDLSKKHKLKRVGFKNQHVQLVDAKDRNWIDISSEAYRTYHYPDGQVLRIKEPQKLLVSASGGHRLMTKEKMYYVKPEWRWIEWIPKEDSPAFVH